MTACELWIAALARTQFALPGMILTIGWHVLRVLILQVWIAVLHGAPCQMLQTGLIQLKHDWADALANLSDSDTDRTAVYTMMTDDDCLAATSMKSHRRALIHSHIGTF